MPTPVPSRVHLRRYTKKSEDDSCVLLMDPNCEFSKSFKDTTGQWTIKSRAAFDPELQRDATKVVAPLPPVISTASYFQHQESNMGNWWGVKLARVTVDPHFIIFFREVGRFGGALDIWLADSMPDNGAEWSNQPVQHKCLEWTGLVDQRGSVKAGVLILF